MEDARQLKRIILLMDQILARSWDWEKKYDKIFALCKKYVWDFYPTFTYYDPDTSYEEDVRAVYEALKRHLKDLKGDSKKMTREELAGEVADEFWVLEDKLERVAKIQANSKTIFVLSTLADSEKDSLWGAFYEENPSLTLGHVHLVGDKGTTHKTYFDLSDFE